MVIDKHVVECEDSVVQGQGDEDRESEDKDKDLTLKDKYNRTCKLVLEDHQEQCPCS